MIGLIIILGIIGLMILFRIFQRDFSWQSLREMPAYQYLNRTIDSNIETGQRLHLPLGHGGIMGLPGAAGFIGIKVIQEVFRRSALSDRPPIASSGDALLSLLSQDAAYKGFKKTDTEDQFDLSNARLTGLTPYSFTAGALPIIMDENVSLNLIIGSFGSEVGLLVDAADRCGSQTIAGSEDLTAQSVMVASAQFPLIGEELFAAGAYLPAGKMDLSSLITQDVCRWVLIGSLIIGAVLKLSGFL